MLNRTTSVARRQSLSRSAPNARSRGIAVAEPLSARPAIVMPAVSPFLHEATVARWRKKEGESFVAGEPIVQIESDIATIDIVAESPGILGQILIPDGTRNVPVQKVMATVARNAEELALLRRGSSSPRPLSYVPPPVRTPSPAPARRPLLSAMDHRPSATSPEAQLSVSRGMATDGASLRRKIVTNMAQRSSGFGSDSKEYFEGII